MSVTSGFFNSLNHDRRYFAEQITDIFSGLIIDGVFSSIGTCFVATADSGLNINIGIGKAWFNEKWVLNDAILPMTAPISELLLDRIDAVVIDVDKTEAVRDGTIKYIQGTPSSTPVEPTMISETNHHQYPICFIRRAAGSDGITQMDIANKIGTAATPFVTGILQTIDLDTLLGQWENKLDQFVFSETSEFTQWRATQEATFDNWINDEQTDFATWYQAMKGQLSKDAAGNLQLEIDKEEVDRILLIGFPDGTKTFSSDGTVITSTDGAGRTYIKTFSNGFLTMTGVLRAANNSEIARMVKTFNADGTLISTVVTYA
ncbi:MAG: hypothetical protein RR475_02245 [Clostridia bacterium]